MSVGFSSACAAPYDDVGDGLPVVFSHGTMLDRTMFAPQLEALRDHYRLVAYDSRARTERWEGPYSLTDLADDCVALLDELEIERCVLAGMSLGGFMAIELALRHPDRLAGLALIATKSESYPAAAVQEYQREFGRLRHERRIPLDVAEWEARIVFGPSTWRERPELPRSWIERYRELAGPAVYWETASWITKDDRTPDLDRIPVPTLVVHGEEDEVIPIELGERMAAALPDSVFVRIPASGHTVTLEQPRAVADALAAFLDDLP